MKISTIKFILLKLKIIVAWNRKALYVCRIIHYTKMKKVIRIDQLGSETEQKPVEFTHVQGVFGWTKSDLQPSDKKLSEVFYLGKCKYDGDMFCAKGIHGTIDIYKGHINSGTY